MHRIGCCIIGLFLCLQSVYAGSNVVIVLDPGHGGRDTGAVGIGKIYEKKITLSVAKKVAGLVDMTPGLRAILTRTGDYYVSLWNRMQIARRAKADLFISLHADAFRNAQAYGASVFVLSQKGAVTAAAKWLAQRDNRSDFATGVSISDQSHHVASVLIDMTQIRVMKASRALAGALLSQLAKVTRMHGNYVEQAPFMVLKSPDIPSVLVELGFLTNHIEARKLQKKAFQDALAKSLYAGIVRYISQHMPYQSRIAKQGMPRYLYYRVKAGETLSKIALKFCLPWPQLKRLAGLKSTHLKIGQVIKVPINQFIKRIA